MTEHDDSDDKPLTLVQHLTELRDRLIRCLIVVGVATVGLFIFAQELYTLFASPLQRLLPEGSSMIATQVTSTFFAPFKLTLFTAVLITIPYLLYQVWSFIAPGLYRHEKRLIVPLLGSSVVLFYLGMAFAYFLVFPLVFGFFSSIAPAGVAYTPDITDFLNTSLKLLLAFGITFEIPIAVVLLIWSGVTSSQALAAKRPFIVVGCFVIAAILTPPDIISQTLLAIPMWLLFEAGIFFGRSIRRHTDLTVADDEKNHPTT
ncbi:MAG: twin-arginine translocase subunit TatC [Spongiibacteraceae bacterium]|jgi:sec-independent protein translocase protein TatC|nr:twin-arginine translocase subunit TatC [Spongiibacteraceae bacterium]